MELRPREYGLDNLKGLLIVCVVLGHTLELLPRTPASQYLYLLIYAFHMPLFTFCTGYFSVALTPKDILGRILYPYILWQTVYYLFYTYVLGISSVGLSYVSPIWLMWYLLSCLLWYFLRPLFQADTLRGILLSMGAVLAVGLLVGLDPNIHRYLALSRTLVFFPFYMAGYYAHTHKAAVRQAKAGIEAALGKHFLPAASSAASLCGALSLFLLRHRLDANWFYEADGYTHPKQWIFRLCHYALAAALSLFLLQITPDRRTFLSAAGQNSVAVYLLHGLLIRWLDGRLPAFVYKMPPAAVIPAALVFALGVSLLLGNSFVKKLFSPLFRFRSVKEISASLHSLRQEK